MVVFTVHEPPNPPADLIDRAEKLVFIKDRFLWLAALFPAIWLLFKGLWLEFVLFVAVVSIIAWGLPELGFTPMVTGIVLVAIQILFGFEAGNVQRAALSRRGWHMVGSVSGRNAGECERRFFQAWLPEQKTTPIETGPTPRANRPVSSWGQMGWGQAKSALSRWRRGVGARA